ncbi:MAG: CaiB/BaiF CoA transferase family protein [Natronomonas sp.]
MPSTGVDRSGPRPLEGISVVDLTQVVAGPFATMNLADLGAEVIKIEAVGRGDRAREIQPVPEYFDTVNRNKRSIEVNLKTDAGTEIVHDLVREADVFVESMKPGRPERFGLAYDDLVAINPNLVYCSISGFGSESPYADLPAWDVLIQAMSGIMGMTGEEGGRPLWSGLPSGDLITAMYTTQSVLSALYARERGDIETEWIEVPMLDAAISWLSARAGHYFGYDEPFPRLGTRHPTIVPFGVFSCADEDIIVAAGTPSLWEQLCVVLDREDLLEDPRFATGEDRVENVHELTDIIEAELGTASAEAWIDRLQAAEIPAGPIHDTKSVWTDPHVRQRGLHRRMEREGRQDADVIDHPIHFAELDTHLGTPPEELGESTDDVLARYGYDDEALERLRENGVIG